MKELKVIGQFFAAIVYSFVFAGLVYAVSLLPLQWLTGLDTKLMVLVLILGGGILTTIIAALQSLLLAPYYWIVKKNIVSLVVSIAIVAFCIIRDGVVVWKVALGHGTSGIVIAIIVTVVLTEILFLSSYGIVSAYGQD